MLRMIFRMIKAQYCNPTPDFLTNLSQRLEWLLLNHAQSEAEYLNPVTLHRRLIYLVHFANQLLKEEETARELKVDGPYYVSKFGNPKRQRTTRQTHQSTGCGNLFQGHFDLLLYVYGFLNSVEILSHRAINQFSALHLNSAVTCLTLDTRVLGLILSRESAVSFFRRFHRLETLEISGKEKSEQSTLGCLDSETTTTIGSSTASIPAQGMIKALSEALVAGAGVRLRRLCIRSVYFHLVLLPIKPLSRGENGLQALVEALTTGCCPALEELDLSGNGLGDAGAWTIASRLLTSDDKCHRLKRLELGENFIGDRGIQYILTRLRESKSLKTLGFSGNMLTRESLDDLKATITSSERGVKDIDVRDNFISNKGLEELAQASHSLVKKQESLLVHYDGSYKKGIRPNKMLFRLNISV